jgi:hypothetical protein
MDDRGFPSNKDRWAFNRYAAFCGRCLRLCRAICWNGSLFVHQKTAGCSLYQLLHHGFHRLLANPRLWTTCGDGSTRQWSSLTDCTISHAHLANFHIQKPITVFFPNELNHVKTEFSLHASKREQKRRFLKRIDDPSKNWRCASNDAAECDFWGDCMDASEVMVHETATKSISS